MRIAESELDAVLTEVTFPMHAPASWRLPLILLLAVAACRNTVTGKALDDGLSRGDALAGGDWSVSGDPLRGDPNGGDALRGDPWVSDPGGDPDQPMTCTSCHGNAQNAAPPKGLAGVTDVTRRGVGAHQSHLLASNWHRTVACDDCHLVPAAAGDPGHIDSLLPAEVTWGFPADANGAMPSFDGTRCQNSYCHGVTLDPGGTLLDPEWTVVNGTQATCGTCHGLPPLGIHPVDTSCHVCHDEIIRSDGTFLAPERHVDGITDVSGTCGICHGFPPDPTTERYAGGGGAHLMHDGLPLVSCRTCHGHMGSGPQHNEGNAVVLQTNVDVLFDPTYPFAGGTTMENLGTPSESYNGGAPTCYVGCHNPVPGDVPDLNNVAIWTDESISCAECHERPGSQPPLNHDLDPDVDDDATIRASCQECHDQTGHLLGTPLFVDPDPTDSFSYAASGTGGLCRTCHDGGSGSWFVGRNPQDETLYWTLPSAHEAAGHDCDACHDRHGSAAGSVLVNREEDLCYGCHDGSAAATDIQGEMGKGAAGAGVFHHPVDDAEQAAGRSVECIDCHNPHQALATNVLEGVAGIDAAGAAIDPAVRDIEQEELCYRCHGDTFNAGRPRTTNKRLDFAPTRGAFHPVGVSGRNTSTAMANNLIGGLTTASTIECTDCHNNEQTGDVAGPASTSTASPQGPHGSTEAFILRDAYWSDPTGPSTWNPANFALCFTCHVTSAITAERDGSRTNFEDRGNDNMHFKHVRDAAGKNITCANCHYNPHSNANVTTTQYVIDGSTYSSAPDGVKTRNVSFSPEVTGSGGYAVPTFWINTTTRERRCYLDCHTKNHNPLAYTPAGQDDDVLIVP